MSRKRRSDLSRTFRKDPRLQEFYLEGVSPTGKTLGVGSYGSVVEVEYKYVICAAKQMHKLLLDPGNEGVRKATENYHRECQLMASLRHPNITLFLGLCFLETSPLPLLVMERLEMSVDDLLECAPNIPLPVKLSILTDTCSGLAYLHGMKTPIVHRDLTARNVLLTSSFTAKIADLGNSRIVSLTPGQLAQTLSKNPGTTVYMAPEALNDSHRYGPSLDVFSFGHLCLYTLIQIFPGDLLAATQVDPDNPGQVIGRTEVERRDVYMKKLEGQFSESHAVLVQLVRQCLDSYPQIRPSSKEILGELQEKKKEIEGVYGGYWGNLLNTGRILAVKDMKFKNKRLKELQDSEARLEVEAEELIATNTTLEADKTRVDNEIISLVREKQEVELSNNQLTTENDRLKKSINELQTKYSEKKQERNTLEADLNSLVQQNCRLESRLEDQQQLVSEKQSLEELVEQLKKNLQVKKASQIRRPHLQTPSPHYSHKKLLEWRQGQDMPVAMSYYIQAIMIEGTVYVGGGYTVSEDDNRIVMTYDTLSSKWHFLPLYNASSFSMAVINSKLVLVGGYYVGNEYSRELGVWQTNNRQWTQPFLPMPTARSRASSICYKHWLVVAGGYKTTSRVVTVEILDVNTNQWSTGPSTPTPWCNMKSVIIENTWYFMGGDCESNVYSASLEAVVTADPLNASIWQQVTPLTSKYSCPLNIGGSLLSVGGRKEDNKPTSSIVRYVPETSTWVPAGELPQPLYNCTCISAADKIYVFGGMAGSQYFKDMFVTVFNFD